MTKLLKGSRWRLLAWLSIDILLLLLLITQLVRWSRDEALTGVATIEEEISSSLPSSETHARSTGDASALMLLHPMFHKDRTFVPRNSPVLEAAASTPVPPYVLTGFMGLSKQSRRAFLKSTAGGKAISVQAGDPIEGWTVSEITPDFVKITLNTREALIPKLGASRTP